VSDIPWFKVDDQFATHLKAIEAGNAACGLWVRAGSWSAGNGTDGVVSKAVLATVGGTPAQAKRLIDVGLWVPDRKGYRFHDWTDFQPSALDTQLAKEKESESGARGNHVKWHVRRGIVNPECPLCSGLES
jgi:hypothetical protein